MVCRWFQKPPSGPWTWLSTSVRLDERARQHRLLYSQGHARPLSPTQPMLIIFLAVPWTGSLTMVKLYMKSGHVPSKQSAGMQETNPHLFSTDSHASAAWRSISRPDYCFGRRARIRQRSRWGSVCHSDGASVYAIEPGQGMFESIPRFRDNCISWLACC
jgi:hypothetical protein